MELKPRATTWHVDPDVSQDFDSMEVPSNGCYNKSDAATSALTQGMQLVAAAARRVWEELYIFKKPVS